jgi:hypothetical protein
MRMRSIESVKFFSLQLSGYCTAQNRTEQNRTEQNRTEQNRTEQNRTEQNRTEQNRTEQKSAHSIVQDSTAVLKNNQFTDARTSATVVTTLHTDDPESRHK